MQRPSLLTKSEEMRYFINAFFLLILLFWVKSIMTLVFEKSESVILLVFVLV